MKSKFLLVAVLAAIANPAAATLMLSANVNGVIFNCADGQLCDTNPLVGQLAIANQIFNGVEIQGSSQFQIIGATDVLNSASFQIVNDNLTPATVTIAINGIGFIGPVNHYAASGSGTWQNANGSTLGLTYWGDASNTQGATTPTDLPGTQLASFSDTAVGPADSFGFNSAGLFVAGPLFGMSLGTTGTLAGWNGVAGAQPTLVGRAQTIIATNVPEPSPIALLGIGLLAFGVLRLRR